MVMVVVIVVVLGLFLEYLSGRKKPSSQRSNLEKLACTLFFLGNKKIGDVANGIRDAKVMKAEALAEIDSAINNLKTSYTEGQTDLRVTLKQLKEVTLPELRDKPGSLEAKARKAKQDYEASVAKGTPLEVYKQNALKYLGYKNKAVENIRKAEDNIQKIEIAIETSKAQYDANLVDLQMMRSEITACVDIPQIQLNESLTRIRDLQSELTQKMDVDNIRASVQQEVNNDTASYSSDLEADFNNL